MCIFVAVMAALRTVQAQLYCRCPAKGEEVYRHLNQDGVIVLPSTSEYCSTSTTRAGGGGEPELPNLFRNNNGKHRNLRGKDRKLNGYYHHDGESKTCVLLL